VPDLPPPGLTTSTAQGLVDEIAEELRRSIALLRLAQSGLLSLAKELKSIPLSADPDPLIFLRGDDPD
jgi:hypothetical protein